MSFDRPLVLLLAIPFLGAVTWMWVKGYDNLGSIRRTVALVLRLAILSLIILALAGPSISETEHREAVVIAADTSASDLQHINDIRGAVIQSVHLRPGDDRLGVVSFGRDARVESPVGPMTEFPTFGEPVDRSYTNIAQGLLLSNSLLPPGYQHRITLMTDGWENVGDALSTVRMLRQAGDRVDVWPVGSGNVPEVRVDNVDVPGQLTEKENVPLRVSIHSTVATSTRLRLYRDRILVANVVRSVSPGESVFTFEQPPLRKGSHNFRVTIAPASDSQTQNNVGSATTEVGAPPTELVISTDRPDAVNVLRSLRANGVKVVYQNAKSVPDQLGYISRYAGIVLVNTPNAALPVGFANLLVPYVRDLGHGLVVLGGYQTYGVGGYQHTGLERVLPVKMQIPRRKKLPTIAVVLLIESLEDQTDINISMVAGKNVVNLLGPKDQIAVNDAQETGHFAVPLQYDTNHKAIDDSIDGMFPGDPMSYVTDLEASARVLKKANAEIKHIILLGDGDAYDGRYRRVVTKIRAAGITVSTVGTNGGYGGGYGSSYDLQNMKNIARWGGGRYYDGNNTNRVPQIFLRETETLARNGIVTGWFTPRELSVNPMMTGINSVTPLSGYVATTRKPAGEVVLETNKHDPLLAGWQFGLGRSVAWTSDSSGEWTQKWVRTSQSARLWANMVTWTTNTPRNGALDVHATTNLGTGTVSVRVPESLGFYPHVTARVVDPIGQPQTVHLQPVVPGEYQGTFPAVRQGGYFISVNAGNGTADKRGLATLDVPYPAEYLTAGTNMSFIRQLARAGGGTVVSNAKSLWKANLTAASSRRDFTVFFLILALLLLPIDIGVRRLTLRKGDAKEILSAMMGMREDEIAIRYGRDVRMRQPLTPSQHAVNERARADAFKAFQESKRRRAARTEAAPGTGWSPPGASSAYPEPKRATSPGQPLVPLPSPGPDVRAPSAHNPPPANLPGDAPNTAAEWDLFGKDKRLRDYLKPKE